MNPDVRPYERALGAVFFAMWRLVGLLALPLLCMHPKTRRHVWRVPHPPPGWTWVHGASRGEHAVTAALRAAHGPGIWPTKTSIRTPVPAAFPAPWDAPWVVDHWLRHARPARLILIESELWPGWILGCRRRGIPVTVVHARESRGTQRWKYVRPLWRWLTADVTFVPQAWSGDLKQRSAVSSDPVPAQLAIVGASTRAGDDERLLDAWSLLPRPRPCLMLAPRRRERFEQVASLLERQNARWTRQSQSPEVLPNQVVLVDTFGDLSGLIGSAQVVFVGGTFSESLGGHSPSEANQWGVPVVAGPYRDANPAAWTEARAVSVQDDDPDTLARALSEAIELGRSAVSDDTSARAARVLDRVNQASPPAHLPEGQLRPWLGITVPLVHQLARRRRAWRDAPVVVPVPVVSVGSLTAGGTGKTPIAGWLAERITGAWVVGRGYRRPEGGTDVRLGYAGTPPQRPLGDELEMLRRRGVNVVSSPDRVAGAEAAIAAGAQLIVLDDGFQHRRLHRDLDIVCVDGHWPTGGGLIPVGTGREPPTALRRADFIWVHNVETLSDTLRPIFPGLQQPHIQSQSRPERWRHRDQFQPVTAQPGPADVVTGLARPAAFLGALADLGIQINDISLLRDHSSFELSDRPTIITEKDAARLPEYNDAFALHCRLEVRGAEVLLRHIRCELLAAPQGHAEDSNAD